KQDEARIEQLATRDALTGLPNRGLLAERTAQAILSAARSRSQLALLAIDLDRFKLVNDSLGHAAGDALLRAVAERLANAARAAERLRVENDLRAALIRSELLLHWQPVVEGRSRIVGAEALVRWQHPSLGLLGPEDFVPLAEDSGLIRAVGEWTLERACAQAGAWSREFDGKLREAPWFAVNVSAAELAQGDLFVDKVKRCLAAHNLDGRRIELEVTERVLMSNFEENARTLRRIGELGVRFAIDDFGTGYSSLAYLRELPIDKLKIDRLFLHAIETNAADQAIVRTIASLAQAVGVGVAAEGLESAAQLDCLLSLGCEQWQGHLFSAPLDAQAFAALFSSALRSERPARSSEG